MKSDESKPKSNENFINQDAPINQDALMEQYHRYPYRWRTQLFFAIILAIMIHYFYSISSQTLFNPKGIEIAKGIFYGIFHPDLSLLLSFSKTAVPFLMLETIAIAFAGTMIGSILALPVTFLSNERIVPKPISSITTAVILFIRTIPTLVWALIWIRVTGPGPFCGVITLGICSIGMLSRLYSNAIDDLDKNLIESLDAMGFNTFQKLRHGILPQLRANFISTSIYRFDINLRDATTLGIVGAGGIGAVLVQALNTGRWSMAGSFIFGFVFLMMIIEYISTYIRKKE